jgi:hypothetical protein
MDILKKTLDEMYVSFSSNEFSKQAKRNGLSQQEVNNGAIAHFLNRNCFRGSSRRLWRKNPATITSTITVEEKSKFDNISAAIALLKSKGYRIMKPTTDWIEL